MFKKVALKPINWFRCSKVEHTDAYTVW